MVMGAICTNQKDVFDKLKYLQNGMHILIHMCSTPHSQSGCGHFPSAPVIRPKGVSLPSVDIVVHSEMLVFFFCCFFCCCFFVFFLVGT